MNKRLILGALLVALLVAVVVIVTSFVITTQRAGDVTRRCVALCSTPLPGEDQSDCFSKCYTELIR